MFECFTKCRPSLAFVAGFLLAGAAAQPAAAEGFHVSVGIERGLVEADYAKSVEIDAPWSKYTARDGASDAADSIRTALEYRRHLSSQVYLAAEVEAVLRLNGGVAGYLLEGTGDGTVDVWPGVWTLEQGHAVGLGARLGYVPEASQFAVPVRSLYLFSGVRRLATEVVMRHENPARGISGFRARHETPLAWRFGVGAEFDVSDGWFDLRAGYSQHDFGIVLGGGLADNPTLGYAFDMQEWSLGLSYVIPLGG